MVFINAVDIIIRQTAIIFKITSEQSEIVSVVNIDTIAGCYPDESVASLKDLICKTA